MHRASLLAFLLAPAATAQDSRPEATSFMRYVAYRWSSMTVNLLFCWERPEAANRHC